MENGLLVKLRNGDRLTIFNQILLIIQLSVPAILAQVSSTIMSFIDASMVGGLGANASASIGLVSSTTWMFGGIITAITTGFTVQVAQRIGAKENKVARNIVKESLLVAFITAMILTVLGLCASQVMPYWLGGDAAIIPDAKKYLMVYGASILFVQINSLASGMVQSSGNMRFPSVMHIVMCFLDVIFNYILIFPTHHFAFFSIPGFNLGVLGAALGTMLSQVVIGLIILFYLLFKSDFLHLRKEEKFHFEKEDFIKAFKIGFPVGIEQIIMGTSYIIVTKIVAPLGTISIAANSFAITAEGLCYMPGFGIGIAATTLIGQSIGAKREDLTRQLGYLCVSIGAIVMLVMGILMYVFAGEMMRFLSPDPAIIALGTTILHIEAFAEPFYGSSIVGANVFRGAGKTLASSITNLCSIWCVRLPLAMVLSKTYGLKGVWIAMCTELIVRGCLYIFRLFGKWDR